METQGESVKDILKRFRRKFIKGPIERHKKKAKWYWPELHLYCGICDLRTGLYIRSIISVFIYIVILVINVLMLYHLLLTGATLAAMEISDIEEYLGINFTEVKIAKVKMVYTVLISYMIFWIVFKFVYIAAIFSTIYAIYKKKPKIIRVVFYISAINWLLDLFISAFGSLLLQVMSRTVAIIGILFEGYNLIALRSEYKQMRGKSKLLMNMNTEVSMETVVASSSPEINQDSGSAFGVTENRKHCESCKCFMVSTVSAPAIAGTVTESTSDTNEASNFESDVEKTPNIKDVDTIFNQNMLVTGQSPILEMPRVNDTLTYGTSDQRPVRPRTLQLRSFSEEKIDIVDTPTIYDENQLNVGRSPVVEDNPNNLPSPDARLFKSFTH